MSTPSNSGVALVNSKGHMEPDLGLVPVMRSYPLAQHLVRLRASSSHLSPPVARRKRQMITADKKDATYWAKRQKNNEAAKKSREKRRLNNLMMEGHLLALSEENAELRAQVFNLHYHSIGKSKVAFAQADETSAPSALASTLPLSPVPAHSPALLQAGLWGNSSASVVSMKQQETTMHQFEGKGPCLSSARGVGVFHSIYNHNYGSQVSILPLSGPHVLSTPEEGLGVRRLAEAELEAQWQVSSTNASPQLLSPIPAFLPTPDALHHASTFSYPPQNWLVPHLNHLVACGPNNLLLPRRPSCLAPPAVYTGLPLQIQGGHGQGLGVEAHIQRGFKGQFSSTPSGLSPLRMQLSSNGP